MSDKNNDILSIALADMTHKVAPDGIWDKIAIELDQEKGIEHLERTVSEMKEYQCETDVWLKVQEELDGLENQDILDRAISSLPIHKYEGEGFDRTLRRFEDKHSVWSKTKYWLQGAAAIVLVWLGMSLYQKNSARTEYISMDYSEEVQIVMPGVMVDSELKRSNEIMTFINEHCNLLAEKCKSPRFKGLLDHYNELDTARQDLIGQINQNHGQAQLINYLVRIEKKQNDIGKKLLKILMS